MSASEYRPLPEGEVWSFGRFQPGATIGTSSLVVDHDMLASWSELFGPLPSDSTVPMAAMPLLLMRTFADVVAPRPAGNLHVAQKCEIRQVPTVGQRMSGQVLCGGKEMRGERRVVHFDVTVRAEEDQALLFAGLTTIFWAL